MLKRILFFLFLIVSVFILGACSTDENTSYVYHPSKTELAKWMKAEGADQETTDFLANRMDLKATLTFNDHHAKLTLSTKVVDETNHWDYEFTVDREKQILKGSSPSSRIPYSINGDELTLDISKNTDESLQSTLVYLKSATFKRSK